MPIFTCTGTRHKDLWLVDDSPAFGLFPGGIIQEVVADTPIHLYVGTPAYGETHISVKHAHWLSRLGQSTPELVYKKLGQTGQIYCTETDRKLKISLRITPEALIVLTLIRPHGAAPHFSVTTIYSHPQRLDGRALGRYKGRN